MKNTAESVRARLLNLSRSSSEPLAALMEQYMTGRFLYRLSKSSYKDQFILKGAQVFRLWSEMPHRSTRDLDLLGFGDSSEETISGIFREITECEIEPEDGLEWTDIKVGPIRDDLDYGGVRAVLSGQLAGARIMLQIDVGFGDIVIPGPVEHDWTSLLDFPSARLLAYPPETVIAEKFEAALTLGLRNSRMKDFFDLHWLSNNQHFEAAQLRTAICATLERRGTPLPEHIPRALKEEFGVDEGKNIQWNAFLRKGKLQAPVFPKVITRLSQFLWPIINSSEKQSKKSWTPGKGWHS